MEVETTNFQSSPSSFSWFMNRQMYHKNDCQRWQRKE